MQGAGLQTGFRPSKDGNDAMPMYTRSETGSNYIRQPRDILLVYYHINANIANKDRGIFSSKIFLYFCKISVDKRKCFCYYNRAGWFRAGVAQSVEQLICNQQVGGSSPSTSSTE